MPGCPLPVPGAEARRVRCRLTQIQPVLVQVHQRFAIEKVVQKQHDLAGVVILDELELDRGSLPSTDQMRVHGQGEKGILVIELERLGGKSCTGTVDQQLSVVKIR